MILVEGRKYKDRTGKVHGPLTYIEKDKPYCFCCYRTYNNWSVEGVCRLWIGETPEDLIEEVYEEPKPAKEHDQMSRADWVRAIGKVFDSYRHF